MKKDAPSLRKSLITGVAAALVIVVFAYGFQITKVNLTELRSETRQESLARVMRALARPDLFAYTKEEQSATAPVLVPCPEGGAPATPPAVGIAGPSITVTPGCGSPGESVQVEGFNFYPNNAGPLRFVPGADPSSLVVLGNNVATTDGRGHFVAQLELPKRTSSEAQYIRATIRRNVGMPQLTETAYSTWDKIVETVFLALLATTIGTVLAIPLSFLAARNLMVSVRSPLASMALSILGWPLGIVLGYLMVRTVSRLNEPLAASLPANLASVALGLLAIVLAVRWALPQEELTPPGVSLRAARILVLILAVLVGIHALLQLAALVMNLGGLLAKVLGPFAFLGTFFFQLGEILRLTTPIVGALVAGSAISSYLGRLGQRFAERSSPRAVKAFNIILAASAGATALGLVGLLIQLLYEIGRPLITLWIPMGVGAAGGLLLALLTRPKDTLPNGLVIYTITRTFLNALRSVEALVMAIVFVIAVGIGPFAGVMALGLHTIVSLGKLYSEQVESISPGPMEAIEATGANRLQTIIYAVVPQIVPPYISYTMYRWDINVRMSTIIGFVGGGGIGFLLQQNINLLNYRAASAQMLAIAVVVAAMDYFSSYMRQKVV
jgi:phosphonate ABC transporter permease subunit PhnE